MAKVVPFVAKGGPVLLAKGGILLVAGIGILYLTIYTAANAPENWRRLVVIVMNNTMICPAAMAGITSGLVIIVTFVVGIILMDHPATVLTGGIVSIIAALAQGGITVPGIVVRPDPLTAPLAAGSLSMQTAFAKVGIIKLRQFLYGMQGTTYTAGSYFFHLVLPP